MCFLGCAIINSCLSARHTPFLTSTGHWSTFSWWAHVVLHLASRVRRETLDWRKIFIPVSVWSLVSGRRWPVWHLVVSSELQPHCQRGYNALPWAPLSRSQNIHLREFTHHLEAISARGGSCLKKGGLDCFCISPGAKCYWLDYLSVIFWNCFYSLEGNPMLCSSFLMLNFSCSNCCVLCLLFGP